MTTKKDKPQKGVYRLSDAFIKRWTRILVITLITGVVGGFIVIIIGSIMYSNPDSGDDLPEWVYAVSGILFSIGFVVPLLLGAILGGLAIHRFGWIPLLLVIFGLIGMGVSTVDGLGYVGPYSIAAMVLGVVGIYVLALGFTKVPVWLQLPILKSPRLYIRKKNKK